MVNPMTIDNEFKILTSKLDNFLGYMPGPQGFLRQTGKPEIVEDLDKTIRETNFDLRTYQELVEKLSKTQEKFRNGEEVNRRIAGFSKGLYKMALPIYLEMRKKGHSIADLSGYYDQMPCEIMRSIKRKDRFFYQI